MKNLYLTVLAFVFLFRPADSFSAELELDPRKITAASVEFELPKADFWRLENGLQVYYYRNDELPLMQGEMYFRGGSLNDDSGITGLASAVGSQMRAGSIEGMSPAELDQKLTDLAANIESSFGDEFGSVSFFSLTEDFKEVFSIFSQVIKKPAFDAKRLALWKELSKEGVSRRRENPGTMSSMAFARLVYGEGSAYADFKSEDSINSINASSLKKFHSNFIRPESALLAVSGSLSKEEAKAAIEEQFGSWRAENASSSRVPFPKVENKIKPGVYVLERDFKQATVYMGHLGPKRHVEDKYSTAIFNRVFGQGGFSSILFREIRSKLGLAYTVSGGIRAGVEAGTFSVSMGTRAEQATSAVKAVIAQIEKVRKELPSEGDFNAAKSATEKSFVFKFADPNFVSGRAVILDILGYSKTYDEQYLSKISDVSREQVLEVAKKHINPEQMVIVIVGNVSPEQVKKDLGGSIDVYRLSFDTEPKVVGKINE